MSKPETWKSWEGRSFEGRFSLRQWLGGTDHSAVFLTDPPGQTPARAAIKLIAVDPAQVEHRLGQLRSARQLSHPNLLSIFEIGRTEIDGESFVYVVMEYAEEDLSQILPQRSLSEHEVSDLLPPLLEALTYLHSKGFVHGRIKPSNVLAVGDQLKLSSDQVTSVIDTDASRRRRDVFDAPESAAGIVSPVGDVWSVGVTLVAAITQTVTIAEETAPGTRSLPETVAEPFRSIVRDCLQLDPRRRCSVRQIEARLLPAGRTVPAPLEPKPVAQARANCGPAIAIAVVIVALAIVFGLLHFHGNSAPNVPASTVQQSAADKAAPASAAPVEGAAKSFAKGTSGSEVTHEVIPDVPKSAQRTIRGTIKVIIEAQVDPSGKVSSTRFRLHGSSAYFAGLAQRAAQRWQFSAPQTDGQHARSAWLLEFRFRRNSTQAFSRRLTR